MESGTGDSMNGLTAEGFELLIDKLREAAKQSYFDCEVISASEIESIIEMAIRMQNNNTTQASRPDRVGDECWYSNWNNELRYVWRRGILRAWLAGDDFAIIEDCETGRVQYKSEIVFSTEAPK
jgi:hypothetical protein